MTSLHKVARIFFPGLLGAALTMSAYAGLKCTTGHTVFLDDDGRPRVVIGEVVPGDGSYGLAIQDAEGVRRGMLATRKDGASVFTLLNPAQEGFRVEGRASDGSVRLAMGANPLEEGKSRFIAQAMADGSVDIVLSRPDGSVGVTIRMRPDGDCGLAIMDGDEPLSALWDAADWRGLGVWRDGEEDPAIRIQLDKKKDGAAAIDLGK